MAQLCESGMLRMGPVLTHALSCQLCYEQRIGGTCAERRPFESWQNVLRLHFFPFAAVELGTFQCDLEAVKKLRNQQSGGVRPSLCLTGCQLLAFFLSRLSMCSLVCDQQVRTVEEPSTIPAL